MESIWQWDGLLWSRYLFRASWDPWEWLGAVIGIECDLHSFVSEARHHTGAGKECVVNGIS